jgi:hypothetical protein
MRDESTKQAAQEFLATKLAEENQKNEEKLNRQTAEARSLHVWKMFRDAVFGQCTEWNTITQEETLTCKETPLGDLRIWCAATSKHITVHFDSKYLTVTINNAARDPSQKEGILQIAGYATESGRDARLIRNNEPVNVPMLILTELRLLTGIGAQRSA